MKRNKCSAFGKRCLAMVLSLFLCIGLLPAETFAWTGPVIQDDPATTVSFIKQDGWEIARVSNDYITFEIDTTSGLYCRTVPTKYLSGSLKNAVENQYIYQELKFSADYDDEDEPTELTPLSVKAYRSSGHIVLEYTFKEARITATVFINVYQTMEGRYIGSYTTTKSGFGGPAVTSQTYLNDFGEDVHGKTWLISLSAGFESPADGRGVTCHMDTIHHRFPYFGHENERKAKKLVASYGNLNRPPEGWPSWQYPDEVKRSANVVDISGGITGLNAYIDSDLSYSEVGTHGYSEANPVLLMGTVYSTFGGVEGHAGDGARKIEYTAADSSPSNTSDVLKAWCQTSSSYLQGLGDPIEDTASASMVWGFRNLYASGETVIPLTDGGEEIESDYAYIDTNAAMLAVVPNGSGYKVKELQADESIPSDAAAVFRGTFTYIPGANYYNFTSGAAYLSPTVSANFDPAQNGYFHLKPDGTIEHQGISLNVPTFCFYSSRGEGSEPVFSYDKQKGLVAALDPDNNGAYIRVDIPYAKARLDSAAIATNGNVDFSGDLQIATIFSGNSFALNQLSLGKDSSGAFKLKGLEAEMDASDLDLFGLQINKAYGKINTMTDYYKFDVDVNAYNIFKFAAKLELMRTKDGVLLPNTLYGEIQAPQLGIPLVPPAPVAEINGGGIGFKDLVKTMDGDYLAIPPFSVTIGAFGKILKTIAGKLYVTAGPTGVEIRGSDLSIPDENGMQLVEELKLHFSDTGMARYNKKTGRRYTGINLSGGINAKINILKGKGSVTGGHDWSDVLIIDGGMNLNLFGGKNADQTYLYIVCDTTGEVSATLNTPKWWTLIGGKQVLNAAAQLSFNLETEARLNSANAFNEAYRNADGYMAAICQVCIGGVYGRAVYVSPKTIDGDVYFSEPKPVNISDYRAKGKAAAAALLNEDGEQVGLAIFEEGLEEQDAVIIIPEESIEEQGAAAAAEEVPAVEETSEEVVTEAAPAAESAEEEPVAEDASAAESAEEAAEENAVLEETAEEEATEEELVNDGASEEEPVKEDVSEEELAGEEAAPAEAAEEETAPEEAAEEEAAPEEEVKEEAAPEEEVKEEAAPEETVKEETAPEKPVQKEASETSIREEEETDELQPAKAGEPVNSMSVALGSNVHLTAQDTLILEVKPANGASVSKEAFFNSVKIDGKAVSEIQIDENGTLISGNAGVQIDEATGAVQSMAILLDNTKREWVVTSDIAIESTPSIMTSSPEQYEALENVSFSGMNLSAAAANLNPESTYELHTYLGTEPGTGEYLIEAVPFTGSYSGSIPTNGEFAETGDYYVSAVLFKTMTADFDGDGVIAEEEVAKIALDRWDSSSTIHFTNSNTPEAPASASIQATGNETLTCSFEQIMDADGYRVRIYQNGQDTGFGYTFDIVTKTDPETGVIYNTLSGLSDEQIIHEHGIYTIRLAPTAGGAMTSEGTGVSESLQPGGGYVLGVSAYKYLGDKEYPVYSAETLSNTEEIREYQPAQFSIRLNDKALAADEATGMYNGVISPEKCKMNIDVESEGNYKISVLLEDEYGFYELYNEEAGSLERWLGTSAGMALYQINIINADTQDKTTAFLQVAVDDIPPLLQLDEDLFSSDTNGKYVITGTTEAGATVNGTAADKDGRFRIEGEGLVDTLIVPVTAVDESGNQTTVTATVTGHIHRTEAVAAVAANCTHEGVRKHYRCTGCGALFEDAAATVPAGNLSTPINPDKHSYGAWKVVTKATLFKTGKQQRTCKLCGKVQSKTIAKIKPTLSLVVGKIKVSATTIPMQKGQVYKKVTAAMKSGDSVKSAVSSNKSIVKVAVSKKTLILTAGKTAGTAKITVKTKAGATSTFKVKVQSGKVVATSIVGFKKTLALDKGKTYQLPKVVKPVTVTDKMTFKSSNTKVATVSSTGLIKAVGKGKATITVTIGKKKFTCALTVNLPPNTVTKVTASKTLKYSTLKTKSLSFTIAATVKDKAKKTFVLSSVPSKVKNYITVSSAGKVTVKKGIPKGTYSIKVKITTAATAKYRKTTVTKTIKIIIS